MRKYVNFVLRLVENNYVEEVNTKDLYYGAIRGMLQSLDCAIQFAKLATRRPAVLWRSCRAVSC